VIEEKEREGERERKEANFILNSKEKQIYKGKGLLEYI